MSTDLLYVLYQSTEWMENEPWNLRLEDGFLEGKSYEPPYEINLGRKQTMPIQNIFPDSPDPRDDKI